MDAYDLSKEILNQMETEKVIQFAKDPVMFSAVKKYILAHAYKHGVINAGKEYNGRINFALNLAWPSTQQAGTPRSDEELGQNLRALTYATQFVESGFKEITELEIPEAPKEEVINKAE